MYYFKFLLTIISRATIGNSLFFQNLSFFPQLLSKQHSCRIFKKDFSTSLHIPPGIHLKCIPIDVLLYFFFSGTFLMSSSGIYLELLDKFNLESSPRVSSGILYEIFSRDAIKASTSIPSRFS